MEIDKDIDNYIKESINFSLGLTVSENTLQTKLRAYEDIQLRLRDRCLALQSKLNEKDEAIERSRAEASMNAQAVKKFVEENKRLADECGRLLGQCEKWEKECSLYDHDREALMDFGNEADERAKEAEMRVHELQEEVRKLSEELRYRKQQCEHCEVDSSPYSTAKEENLLEPVVDSLITEDAVAAARAFVEANTGQESFQKLLNMWNRLSPSTLKVLSLAARMKTLEKEKEQLTTNLRKAEEEVNMLYEENKLMVEENKKLLRQKQREKSSFASAGKHADNESVKSNKRKCSPRVDMKIDFDDLDSTRQPLSTLQSDNSPDCRMHKK